MIVTDFPTCRINGLTHLNLAKLDVLDTLDEVKIGVRYRAKDGTILSSVPADLEILEGVTVGGEEKHHVPNSGAGEAMSPLEGVSVVGEAPSAKWWCWKTKRCRPSKFTCHDVWRS